jgi:glycosyltransferase involved in cell wall biosynthesis
MPSINIVVPPLSKMKFSGGILCVMEYASGLAKQGHKVMITPILPCHKPEWFDVSNLDVIVQPFSQRFKAVINLLINTICLSIELSVTFNKNLFNRIHANFQELILSLLLLIDYRFLTYHLQRAISLSYIRGIMPDADVTIATAFPTALPVSLYGTGSKHYFIQHFEPIFKNDFQEPLLAEYDAKASYSLGLNMIANSPWLKARLEDEVPVSKVELCENAINHEIFYGEPKFTSYYQEIKIISYGGRKVVWKGFKEMAEAINLVRNQVPQFDIRWLVYGSAILPPDNDIARYESLGFLQPKELAKAYREADILLSASWYESFPLFPIEAMACGLPVITTQYGTESYAIHGETAEVVEPRNPDSIANGIIKLIENIEYRHFIAVNGNKMSKNYIWNKSISNMEKILKISNI